MLTERQLHAFMLIKKSIIETGTFPTYAAISRHIGARSRSNAFDVVRAIVERGYLRRLSPPRNGFALVERPPITIERKRTRYFRFDDETKRLVEWQP